MLPTEERDTDTLPPVGIPTNPVDVNVSANLRRCRSYGSPVPALDHSYRRECDLLPGRERVDVESL